MIEIIPIKEYERTGFMDYPYREDPLFEYLNQVANYFWWEPDPEFDEETNRETLYQNPSYVPSRFARRYLDGRIDLHTLPSYIDAVGEEILKKHIPMSDWDKTLIGNNPINNIPNISMTLKAYGLDISKFWYLCICVKDWVEGQTCEGARITHPTHRQELRSFVEHISKLDPQPWCGMIKTKGKARLTLNVKGRNMVIEDGQTLSLIGYAVDYFLEQDTFHEMKLKDGEKTRVEKFSVLLDSSKMCEKRLPKPKAKTVKLALFYKYLNWFMEQRDIDESLVKNYPYLISTNKDLLISRMAYLTGLTNNNKFLEPDDAGKGYIRTAISGYEGIEVKVHNKYYNF